MTDHAAHARKWMLWSAPAMALAGFPMRAGGAALGLGLWIGLGLLLSGRKGQIRLYPKQRRLRMHRLALGYSFCVFCLAGFDAAGRWLLDGSLSFLTVFPLLLGDIAFSLTLGVWAMQWPLRKRAALLLSFLFLGASVFLFFSS